MKRYGTWLALLCFGGCLMGCDIKVNQQDDASVSQQLADIFADWLDDKINDADD